MDSNKGFILTRYTIVMFLLFWVVIGIIILTHKMNMYIIENDYSFKLIGNEEITLLEGEEYIEPGFKILSKDGINLSKYVNVSNNIEIDKIGTYEVKYKSKYNKVRKKLTRKINVIEKEVSMSERMLEKMLEDYTPLGMNCKVLYLKKKSLMDSQAYLEENSYLTSADQELVLI